MVLTLPLAVVVLLKGKVWTGLLGMFIVVLLFIGAMRLSRPHAPWARWRYTSQPDKMRRALDRERTLRRPVVQAKLWLQCAIAGTPRIPDERAVDAQLDHDVHPAPPPEGAGADRLSLQRARPADRRSPVRLRRCGTSTTPSSSTTAAPSS